MGRKRKDAGFVDWWWMRELWTSRPVNFSTESNHEDNKLNRDFEQLHHASSCLGLRFFFFFRFRVHISNADLPFQALQAYDNAAATFGTYKAYNSRLTKRFSSHIYSFSVSLCKCCSNVSMK